MLETVALPSSARGTSRSGRGAGQGGGHRNGLSKQARPVPLGGAEAMDRIFT
ncbi:hypothetical protein [Streptosporangium sp. NPDC004631]